MFFKCKNAAEIARNICDKLNIPREALEDSEREYEMTCGDVFAFESEKLSIIEDIFRYAERNPSFNNIFITSVDEYLQKHGKVTMKQYNALVNIYNSFNIRFEPYD